MVRWDLNFNKPVSAGTHYAMSFTSPLAPDGKDDMTLLLYTWKKILWKC